MKTLSLNEAAIEIMQATRGAPKKPPFVIIVGAGASAPNVPLAGDIAAHCEGRARGDGRSEGPTSSEPMDSYSWWLEHAYPHAKQRQTYLRTLIEGQPIPAATLRLANLLLDGRLARAVITPNFDDFVARALTLFGRQHVVCDHPGSVQRIDAESDDLQIVQVHGSYWFYDCCNLRGEIEARALSPGDQLTMASLLDSFFDRHSPIVVGYSGWKNDVIMTALARRLQRGLPYNLYWFCFRSREVDTLPDWLRNHPQVRIVRPGPPLAAEHSRGPDPRPLGAAKVPTMTLPDEPVSAARSEINAPPSSGAAEGEPTLGARQVFDTLIRRLDLGEPGLTRNPLMFFAEQLKSNLGPLEKESLSKDVFGITAVIDRVDRAIKHEIERDQLLDAVRSALRRSQYGEVIAKSRLIVQTELNLSERMELVDTLCLAAEGLDDNSPEELYAYDRAVETAEAVLRDANFTGSRAGVEGFIVASLRRKASCLGILGKRNDELSVLEAVEQRLRPRQDEEGIQDRVSALAAAINVLDDLKRYEDVLSRSDEVLALLKDRRGPARVEYILEVTICRAFALAQRGGGEAGVEAYRQAVEMLKVEQSSEGEATRAKLMINLGTTWSELGRVETAIAAYDEAMNVCKGKTESLFHEPAARAMFNKGVELETHDRKDEARVVYEDIDKQFGNTSDPDVLFHVGNARLNRGSAALSAGDTVQAMELYGIGERIPEDTTNEGLKMLGAKLLLNRGLALGKLGREAEAERTFAAVGRRLEGTTDTDGQELFALALINQGVAAGKQERYEDARRAYQGVVDAYGDASELKLRRYVSFALLNVGQACIGLKDNRTARDMYREVIRRNRGSDDEVLKADARLASRQLAGVSKGAARPGARRAKSVQGRSGEDSRYAGDGEEEVT